MHHPKREPARFPGLLPLALLLLGLALLACATVGRDFPSESVRQIRIGETTRERIHELFGDPWRTGVEDGMPTWTYARYRYVLFGDEKTKDLVIRYDEQGIVRSYTFNTTEEEESEEARGGLKPR
jgi:hypothetical protein